MKYRIGLIGAGNMGRNHARILSNHPRTTLDWIYDPDSSRAARVAEEFQTKVVTEPSLSVDAVVIASPTPTHAKIAETYIRSGIPALIEKPIAESWAEIEQTLNASDECSVPIMCGFVERFNPISRTLFDIVKEPIHIRTVRHSPPTPRIQSSVAVDLLVHDVDLVLNLFRSDAIDVFSIGDGASGTDDIAEAVMRFSPFGVASLSASRRSQTKIRELVVYEATRMIVADLLRHTITISQNRLEEALPEGRGYRQQTTVDIPMIQYSTEPLLEQLNQFCGLLDGSLNSKVEIEKIRNTHKLMCRIVDQISSSR